MKEHKLLEKYHGKSRWKYLRWDCSERFLKLAKDGIFIPFADALEYQENGIMLTGHMCSGKTTLSRRFVRYNSKKSRILSEDSTTNLFDGENNYVYLTERGINASLRPIIENGTRYPIVAIFDLITPYNHTNVEEGNLEQVLHKMFSSGFPREEVSKELFNICYEAYRKIPVIKLTFGETIKDRYHAFREALKSLKI